MLNRLVDRPALGGKTDASESDSSAGILSGSEKAKKLCSDILEEIGGIKFNVEEISKSLSDEEKGPYQYVFLQECECMNVLVRVMVKTLSELQLGLKGELTMSEQMEQLMESLIFEQIPPRWAKVSFASNRSLLSWLVNLKERCAQLEEWVSDPSSIPKVVDLSKLFNPQSFLNAIKQTACQRQNCELDKLQVITEVTKKTEKAQVEAHSRDGAFVTGLFLEGARWDMNTNSLEESRAKEMFNKMPIINCKAGVVDETSSQKNTYICPTYCTAKRRPNYVFSAQLRTVKYPPSKWTLAGVALILDIGQ
jgi:dynein heavy chain